MKKKQQKYIKKKQQKIKKLVACIPIKIIIAMMVC